MKTNAPFALAVATVVSQENKMVTALSPILSVASSGFYSAHFRRGEIASYPGHRVRFISFWSQPSQDQEKGFSF